MLLPFSILINFHPNLSGSCSGLIIILELLLNWDTMHIGPIWQGMWVFSEASNVNPFLVKSFAQTMIFIQELLISLRML